MIARDDKWFYLLCHIAARTWFILLLRPSRKVIKLVICQLLLDQLGKVYEIFGKNCIQMPEKDAMAAIWCRTNKLIFESCQPLLIIPILPTSCDLNHFHPPFNARLLLRICGNLFSPLVCLIPACSIFIDRFYLFLIYSNFSFILKHCFSFYKKPYFRTTLEHLLA